MLVEKSYDYFDYWCYGCRCRHKGEALFSIMLCDADFGLVNRHYCDKFVIPEPISVEEMKKLELGLEETKTK